jgi:DNA-binding MarR family transcriptional regulator
MSSKAADPPARTALLEKLFALGRVMSTQTVFLHQAIAQTVGLNATDTKCIDLVLRAPGATLTAGQLSALSGLTSGAITHILDRLEKRGFIARRRDTADRRKIFIRVRSESLAPLVPQYEAIGRAYMTLLAQYRDEELRLICDYLEKTSAVSARELARLVAAARGVRANEA